MSSQSTQLTDTERRQCVAHCEHDPKFYRLNNDPRATEENKIGPMCWHEDDDGFCGHRCGQPRSAAVHSGDPWSSINQQIDQPAEARRAK